MQIDARRARICDWRYSGRWSAYFDTRTCVSSPSVGRAPSIRRAGAGAWVTPSSQARQAYFGRYGDDHPKLAGTMSRSVRSADANHLAATARAECALGLADPRQVGRQMTDVALCGRALGTWRAPCSPGPLQASASAPSSSSKASWIRDGASRPVRPARSETAVAIAQRRDLGEPSRAACCPSNNTRRAVHPGSTMPVLVSMTYRAGTGSRPFDGRRTRPPHPAPIETNNASLRARRITPLRRPERPWTLRRQASRLDRRLGRNTTTTPEKGSTARARPAARASCPLLDASPPRSVAQNPLGHRRARSAAAISAMAKRRYPRVPSRRAPRSTPNRPDPAPPQGGAGSDWMRQRSARPRPCARPRSAGRLRWARSGQAFT